MLDRLVTASAQRTAHTSSCFNPLACWPCCCHSSLAVDASYPCLQPSFDKTARNQPQPAALRRIPWLLRPLVLALVESARAVQITLAAAATLLLETFERLFSKLFFRGGDAAPQARSVVQEAKGRWQTSTADMPNVSFCSCSGGMLTPG